MSLKIKKSAGAGVHIDEGEYTAVIESIQPKKWEDGGESFSWAFKIKNATLDGDPIDGPVRVTALATAIFTPKSKLTKFAEGAGLDIESDELDLEEAIGRTVRVYVEDYETKEGVTLSRVTKVKRGKKPTEDEEKPKKKVKKVEDDEDEKPKKVKKPAKNEDDEEEAPKKVKKQKEEDEDDEEEKPKSKKVAKPTKKEDDDDDLFNFEDDDEDD